MPPAPCICPRQSWAHLESLLGHQRSAQNTETCLSRETWSTAELGPVLANLLQSCLTLVTPWTIARQAPLSMGFFRQEYWSGLPCFILGDLPNPGIEPVSLTSPALVGRFFTSSATWEALGSCILSK